MPRDKPVLNVHDHFDGAALCVECDGPCRLTGHEMLSAKLVRCIIEHAVNTGWLNDYTRMTLEEQVGKARLKILMDHAKKARE